MNLSSVVTNIYSVFIITGLVLLCSCRDQVVSPVSNLRDQSYFPLVTGNWVEYSADSIIHLDADDQFLMDTSILSFHFQVREVVDTSFTDGENEKAFVILRYKRDSDSLPWTFTNAWTAKLNQNSAQKVEDNVRFIKLKFPVSETASWNGNAFNIYPEEDYVYQDLYTSHQYGSLTFDSTITVLQNEFISHINRIYKKEIYAPRTGLLYKENDSVTTSETVNGTIILDGLEYKLTITDYKH